MNKKETWRENEKEFLLKKILQVQFTQTHTHIPFLGTKLYFIPNDIFLFKHSWYTILCWLY